MMKNHQSIYLVIFLVLALGMGWTQNDSGQQPVGSDPQSRTAPVPAFGQENAPALSEENPPISGLDQPSLEPRAAARSFLLPGVLASQSVDSNVAGSTGNTAIHGVTRALGTLTLERLWSNYVTALDYVGGGAFYSGRSRGNAQVQELQAYQRILWRTGQLSIRDSFSYLPEGSFGYSAYGGAGGYPSGLPGLGIGGGGLSGGGPGAGTFFGGGQFGSLGQHPYLQNVAVAEASEALSRRSSVTVAGAYSLTHFTGDTVDLLNPRGLINSGQVSAQAGYNYQLNRKDQVGALYGFQNFRYPRTLSGNFTAHVWHLLYGHRISGRMDLVLAGGPQLLVLRNPLVKDSQRLSFSGRATLRYRLRSSNLSLSYSRYTTSGSGFFVGANSDILRLALSHPITRRWELLTDVGYAHNSRIQPGGIAANSYRYVYAGAAVHRKLGRSFGMFMSYQFNDLVLGSCTSGGPCDQASQRHVATAGLDWHPRPIRLD